MIIFDGRKFASQIEQELKKELQNSEVASHLVILTTSSDEASNTYVRMKERIGERLGITVQKVTVTLQTLPDELKRYAAADPEVTGLMVQLPVLGFDKSHLEPLLRLIPLEKDVDGLNPQNLELIKTGQQTFLPATVLAVERILAASPLEFESEFTTAAVVGASGMVGGPLSDRLEFLGFKVGRFELGSELTTIRDYSVIISCTGMPNLIKAEMIKPNAIVIDVGYPQGDVDFEAVKNKVTFITPVPGGVGPVTVASLMENLINSSFRA